MKHGIFCHIAVLLVGLLLALAPLCMAQTGSVSGSVIAWVPTDSVQAPLPGTHISIPAVDLGAVTDLDGNFHISGVPVGSYDLEARFIGYQPKIVKGVSVRKNQTTIVEIFLGEEFRFPNRLGQCRDDGMGARAAAIDTQMNEPAQLSMTEVGPWGDLRGIRLLGDSLYNFVRPIDASMDPPITSWQAPIDSTLSNEVVQVVSDAIDGAADNYARGLDGATYRFLIPEVGCAEVWSPAPESQPGRLVTILERLVDHVMLSEPGERRRSRTFILQLLNDIEK